MPKIDIASVPARLGSGYPPPFDAPCATRTRQRLGNAAAFPKRIALPLALRIQETSWPTF